MSKKFQSFLAPVIENDFIPYQIASGRWNQTYEKNLFYFDRYCYENHSDASMLTQEMVNSWCAQRTTENNKSRIDRTSVIRVFIKYLQTRDKTDIHFPKIPSVRPSTYVPHAFTDIDLSVRTY